MTIVNQTENAKITSTKITMEDHGCLTFFIGLEGAGWGCGFGGYCIGHGCLGYKPEKFTAENGGGLVAMMRIMDTVGVERWEDLKGKYIRVRVPRIGETVRVIGNLIENKWFDIDEFFKTYKEGEIK